MACTISTGIQTIHPHDLARDLHAAEPCVLVDCRPVLAFNTCHISGAVNVNFTGMMKKRFLAGKISLADLVTTEEGRERFRTCDEMRMVVYDEDTSDPARLTDTHHSLVLVITALSSMGRTTYVLEGGLSEFGTLHPSLCEISLPPPRAKGYLPPPPRATTPGVREQSLDWQIAPPVHVLSFLVLGSEKDAKSREVFDLFNIKYVLNVTPACPNHFEREGVVYKRIPVKDTGAQKLSDKFKEAFEYIEEAHKNNAIILIHCMAGISRSVTLTIAYLMSHFRMSMQNAYQFVKDKRPAISPNLNFMGQLVEFERELELNPPKHKEENDLSKWLPTAEQQKLSVRLSEKIIRTASISSLGSISSPPRSPPEKDGHTRRPSVDKPQQQQQPPPFLLKPVNPRGKRGKKFKEALQSSTSSSSSSSSPFSILPQSSSTEDAHSKGEPLSSNTTSLSSPSECTRVSSSLVRLNLVEENKEGGASTECKPPQERLISTS